MKCHEPADTHCSRDGKNMLIGMTRTSDGKEECVANCPTGSYANLRTGRCECPEHSHMREMDGTKYCECPPFSTWSEDTKKCMCPGTLTLSHKGCVKDNSGACYKKSNSWYEEGSNVCVTVMNCPAAVANCKRCE